MKTIFNIDDTGSSKRSRLLSGFVQQALVIASDSMVLKPGRPHWLQRVSAFAIRFCSLATGFEEIIIQL